MFIKSVVIDGFKSYGRRTEIHGFDPEFTAITGLNGTGKSNILDSICFVLGIMNLGQVRATSLQDLVYKSGQAGITKATVTLIFDNTNPVQCPLGYEKCREISVTRQIVVGGKNKYLINGKLVQNKKVSDFFCSVQLNVNNPNFLIMQGRITKVLNMKPQEILSMIEEAAGTSMYETKREATTKLMEKKDAKVRETNALLQEEVEPKLEKLRRERAAHLEFQKICRDIEYLTRIHISFRWLKQSEAIKFIDDNISKLTKSIDDAKLTICQNNEELNNALQKISTLKSKIENESSSDLKAISDELDKEIKQEAKLSGTIKANHDGVKQEESKLKELQKNIADDEENLRKKKMEMEKKKHLFQSLKDCEARDILTYQKAQERYEAVCQGLSTNDDGQACTLQDQLMRAKQSISEAQTMIKTSDMELKHFKSVLQQKENETQNSDVIYNKDKKLFENLSAEIGNIRKKMDILGYSEGEFENLQDHRKQIQGEIKKLQQQLEYHNAYRFDLQYIDPEPGFNRKKVHGMVGKLFNVTNESHYLALMVTAGGNLYSYVTDDDVTSKKLLQKGQLQQRVTIIPINKISPKAINISTVNFAKSLVGKENVDSALSLISADEYFEPVMKFVFGHTLICKDLNIAKQVTYHRNVHCRTVTIEGDVVDPDGTLSGGSKPKGGNILQELADIKKLEEDLQKCKASLINLETRLQLLEVKATTYNKLKEILDLRNHELNACKQRLEQTTFHQHQEEIITLKQRIEKLKSDLTTAQDIQNKSQAKVKEIETKLNDAKGFRERELKLATEEMKIARLKAEKSSDNWKKHEQEYDTLLLEIETRANDINNSKDILLSLEEQIVKKKADLAEMRLKNQIVCEGVSNLRKKIKEQKDKISFQNRELKYLFSKCDEIKVQNENLVLEIKKKENEVNKVRSDNKESLKKIESLEKKYPWITEEKQFFGIKNTRYDYCKENPVEAGEKLNALITQKEKMERTINLKAMVLLEREEEQYHETMRRKKIVEQDKEKIKHIICKMDEKKREKVEKAWKIVDENFSSIFSTLLQGAQARLNPVKQNNHLIGLEIKVGFNGIWKESLGELSGGQRSLVALSLVLAMLKFSPAPIYILDEVDAALDMSHTQNIGHMLKAHFTSSQFIIVSLKDGMFNNANVLFRTRFEEGVSAVTRTENPRVLRH